MDAFNGVVLVILLIILYTYMKPAPVVAAPVAVVAPIAAPAIVSVDTSGYAITDEAADQTTENFSTSDVGGMLLQLPSKAKAGVVGFSNTLQRRLGMGSAAAGETFSTTVGTNDGGFGRSSVLPY